MCGATLIADETPRLISLPHNFQMQTACFWAISTQDPASHVYLLFNMILLPSGYVWGRTRATCVPSLEVFDGRIPDNNTANLINPDLCQKNYHEPVISTGDAIFVRLNVQANNQPNVRFNWQDTRTIFHATYQAAKSGK